jgi:hypothetical protein
VGGWAFASGHGGHAGDRFLATTTKHQVATPVNWKNGEDVIIVPAVSDEDAK